jgi:hypothetical protein
MSDVIYLLVFICRQKQRGVGYSAKPSSRDSETSDWCDLPEREANHVLDQLKDYRTEKAEKKTISKKDISKDFRTTLGNVRPEVCDILVTHVHVNHRHLFSRPLYQMDADPLV